MNKYEQLQQIGRGSFGVVYKCRMKNTGQFVALKIISMYGKTQQDLEQLQKEIDLLKQINHPNIIKFYESFEEDNNICIVTELAQTDLYEIIADKSLEINQIQQISYQVVSVINELHKLRVVHRDIKPQNVLISTDGKCKLCDFGFARQMSAQTMNLHSIKGSPIYLAPEIAKNMAYNSKSDIWSLGIMLFELSTGKAPFLAKDFIQLLGILQSDKLAAPFDKYPIFKEFPVFKSFIEVMLRKNPDKRYSAEKLLQHPFLNDNSSNLLLIKNVNDQICQRDWYQKTEYQIDPVDYDVPITIQEIEDSPNIYAKVNYISWKQNTKELNQPLYVEFPIFEMFIDAINNPNDIDSIFTSSLLSDFANKDKYISIDYAQLNALKGQQYWQIKLNFIVHCLVISPGFFLKIVICLAQYRLQQLNKQQLYQVISLVRCLCFIFGSTCSFDIPLIINKEVSFPNEIFFTCEQIQIPLSQNEKIQFTKNIHNQANLINAIAKEKHLIDAFEILISILQQLLPEPLSQDQEINNLRTHLIRILIVSCDTLFSFSQLLFISYIPFLKQSNKIITKQKNPQETEKSLNYDCNLIEIQSQMLQQHGKPKLPEYFDTFDTTQLDTYYFENLDINIEKQEFVLVVVYKLIVHFHDHMTKTSSLIFDNIKKLYNLTGKTSIMNGSDQLFNAYLENCIIQFYQTDQKSTEQIDVVGLTPEIYKSMFIGLENLNKVANFEFLITQKYFAQLIFSMIQDFQIILPLLIQRKMEIPAVFNQTRRFIMDEVYECDFVQDIQSMQQKYRKPYQLQKAIFEDPGFNLKGMFDNQKYFIKLIVSVIPFLYQKSDASIQYQQGDDEVEKALKITQNHFLQDYEQLSIQLLSSLFYSDTTYLLPHCFHLLKDKQPYYFLNTYLDDQQQQNQFILNDDCLTLNYLKDYCNQLQQQQMPFRGHQILMNSQLVSTFENMKNLHLPLSSTFQQNGMHGNNIFQLGKLFMSSYLKQTNDFSYFAAQTIIGGCLYYDQNTYKIFAKVLTVGVNMHSVVDFKQLQYDFLYQGAPYQCIKQGSEEIDEHQLSVYENNTEERVKYFQFISFMIENNPQLCKQFVDCQFSAANLTISYISLLIVSIFWIPASAREEEIRIKVASDLIKQCPALVFKTIEQDSESIMSFMGQEQLQSSVIISDLLGRLLVYMKSIAIQYDSLDQRFDYQLNYILNFSKDVSQGKFYESEDQFFKYPYYQLSSGTRIVLPIVNEIYESNLTINVVLRSIRFLNILLDLKFPFGDKYDEIITFTLLSLEKLIDTLIVEPPLMSSISTEPASSGYLDCIYQFLTLISVETQSYFPLLNKLLIISNLQLTNSVKQATQSTFAPPLHINVKPGISREHQLVCAFSQCPTCLYNINNSTYTPSKLHETIDSLHKIQQNRNYPFIFYHWDFLFSPTSMLYLCKILDKIIAFYTLNHQKYDRTYTTDLSNSLALPEALRLLCATISKQSTAAQIISPAQLLGGQQNTENLFMLIVKTIILTEQILTDPVLLPLILLEFGLPEALLHANQYLKNQKSLQYALTLICNFVRFPLPAIAQTFANHFSYSGAVLSDYKNFMLEIHQKQLKNLSIVEYLSIISQIARVDRFYVNFLSSVLDFNQIRQLYTFKNLQSVLFNLCANLCKFSIPSDEFIAVPVEVAVSILAQESPDKSTLIQIFHFINYLNLHENSHFSKFQSRLGVMKQTALSTFNDLDLRYSALLAMASFSRFLFADLKQIGLESVIIGLFKTIEQPQQSNFAFFDSLEILIKGKVLDDNFVDDLLRRLHGWGGEGVLVVKRVIDARK